MDVFYLAILAITLVCCGTSMLLQVNELAAPLASRAACAQQECCLVAEAPGIVVLDATRCK